MDSEKRARWQSRRVIISEALMVISVVATVTILAFIVSGYWLNSNFEVERQGMLQISSLPTGATIEVDGASSWLQRTNSSKVVSSGEHTVTLTKDGYDSWTKTVNVSEGLLYRLHYPRLFLTDRTKEIISLTSSNSATPETVTKASVSPDRNSLLLIDNTTSWSLTNLNNDKPALRAVDISKVFPSSVSIAAGAKQGLFTGTIKSLNWARDNEHILFEIENTSGREWILVNIKNPTDFINLTREFAADFSEVKILNDSASSLLALLGGNLRRIDVPSRQLSAILAEKVNFFDHYDLEVVFATDSSVQLLDLGNGKITPLLTTETPSKPVISKFYDDKYITILEGTSVSVYQKQDFAETFAATLSFAPEKVKVGHDGEFILMYSGGQIATLDMEATLVREWSLDADFGWLDNDMLYDVKDGVLTVYDYDGLNARALASNVSSTLPVTITSDKWLYYFSDKDLIREVIAR